MERLPCVRLSACASPWSGTSSGSASRVSTTCRRPVRSRIRSSSGSRLEAREPSRPCSSRCWRTRRRSSRRWATTSSGAAHEPSSRAVASSSTRASTSGRSGGRSPTSTMRASGRSRRSGRSSRRGVTTTGSRGTSSESMDAVFFVAGDVDALVQARRARVLTATSRELDVLRRGGVELDALVGSGEDRAEHYSGDLDPSPRLVVTTSGSLGGWARPGGPFSAATPPGDVVDSVRRRRQLRGRAHVRARGGPHRRRRDCLRCALRRRGADGQGRRAPARRRPLTGTRRRERSNTCPCPVAACEHGTCQVGSVA